MTKVEQAMRQVFDKKYLESTSNFDRYPSIIIDPFRYLSIPFDIYRSPSKIIEAEIPLAIFPVAVRFFLFSI